MTDDEPTVIIEAGEDNPFARPGESAAEKRREDAFNAGYNWKGQTFDGLPCSRKDLWTALCYKAGFPPLKAGFDDLQWFVPAAKALVWVCLVPARELRKLRALGMDAVQESFEDWVDENVRINEESKIVELAQQILIDSNENQAEAAPGAGSLGK